MLAKISFEKIPVTEHSKAKRKIKELFSFIEEKELRLFVSDVRKVGFNKHYGLTVTFAMNAKMVCIVCQERNHKTMQFRLSWKKDTITCFCSKSKQAETLYSHTQSTILPATKHNFTLLQKFLDVTLLKRYAFRVESKNLQKIKKRLEFVTQNLEEDEKSIMKEILHISEKRFVNAHVLWELYTLWYEKFTMQKSKLDLQTMVNYVKKVLQFVEKSFTFDLDSNYDILLKEDEEVIKNL
jgi:hypothetical protein